VDIPATLASRVRLLGTGRSDKNDPNDARSVAIAALRATELVPVRVEDHAWCSGWCRAGTSSWLVLQQDRMPSSRAGGGPGAGRDQQRSRCCQARSLLADHPLIDAVAVERHALALDLIDELERLNTQRKALRKRIAVAVDASGTTLTEIFGVGDVSAAIILGQVGDVGRFRTADRFAAYNGNAPIEWSSANPARPIHRLSRRGNRTLNHVIRIAVVTQLRHRHSPRRAYYDGKRTQGLTGRAPLRSLKRRISDAIYGVSWLTPPGAADRPGRAVEATTPQACVTGPIS
jgi:transposase